MEHQTNETTTRSSTGLLWIVGAALLIAAFAIVLWPSDEYPNSAANMNLDETKATSPALTDATYEDSGDQLAYETDNQLGADSSDQFSYDSQSADYSTQPDQRLDSNLQIDRTSDSGVASVDNVDQITNDFEPVPENAPELGTSLESDMSSYSSTMADANANVDEAQSEVETLEDWDDRSVSGEATVASEPQEDGFWITADGKRALVVVDGEMSDDIVLHNGDRVDLLEAEIQIDYNSPALSEELRDMVADQPYVIVVEPSSISLASL